jgi:glycerol-3-phosphate acyltransferase PlsX
VVTDGFTGNVALKLMEGTAKTVTGAIRDAARSNPLVAAGGLLMRPALGGLRRELHPDTTGGAILLGLRGIAVVGHGSSGAEGIANAVRLAARCAEVDAVGRTAALLHEGGATRGSLAAGGDA